MTVCTVPGKLNALDRLIRQLSDLVMWSDPVFVDCWRALFGTVGNASDQWSGSVWRCHRLSREHFPEKTQVMEPDCAKHPHSGQHREGHDYDARYEGHSR